MNGCLACDLASGELALPGGAILQTDHWRIEHCIGPLGVGTLIVKPTRHVLHVGELTAEEAREMGPLLRVTAEAVRDLTDANQVYVCLWSHGPVHIHYVVQPVSDEAITQFGASGPGLQAAMFARGGMVEPAQATAFAARARAWLARHGA
jgi:diadenosine tetraphosphate (Ap4A) HIT family hydrolase